MPIFERENIFSVFPKWHDPSGIVVYEAVVFKLVSLFDLFPGPPDYCAPPRPSTFRGSSFCNSLVKVIVFFSAALCAKNNTHILHITYY